MTADEYKELDEYWQWLYSDDEDAVRYRAEFNKSLEELKNE